MSGLKYAALSARELSISMKVDKSSTEEPSVIQVGPDANQISIKNPENGDTSQFHMDHLYDCRLEGSEADVMKQMHEDICSPILADLLQEKSNLIVVFGKDIGSKYELLYGDMTAPMTESAGLLPRIVYCLFDEISKRPDSKEYTVEINAIDITDEVVRDAFDIQNTGLVPESHGCGFEITKVSSIAVTSYCNFEQTLNRGLTVIANSNNFCRVRIFKGGRETRLYVALIEGSYTCHATLPINHLLHVGDLSSSALFSVLYYLSGRKFYPDLHVPYEKSVFTQLIKEHIESNSRITMIGCIGDGASQFSHSISSLYAAYFCRHIQPMTVEKDPTRVAEDPLKSVVSEKIDTGLRVFIEPKSSEHLQYSDQMLTFCQESHKRYYRLAHYHPAAVKNAAIYSEQYTTMASEALEGISISFASLPASGIMQTLIVFGPAHEGKYELLFNEINGPESENAGIAISVVRDLFKRIKAEESSDYHLELSLIQVYCETITDALNSGATLDSAECTLGDNGITTQFSRKAVDSEAELFATLKSGYDSLSHKEANVICWIFLRKGAEFHSSLMFVQYQSILPVLKDQEATTALNEFSNLACDLSEIQEFPKPIDEIINSGKMIALLKSSILGPSRTRLMTVLTPNADDIPLVIPFIRLTEIVGKLSTVVIPVPELFSQLRKHPRAVMDRFHLNLLPAKAKAEAADHPDSSDAAAATEGVAADVSMACHIA